MALQAKVGSLAQPGSTGNQAYTGVGFQPKLILFYWNNKTADGDGAGAVNGFGVGSDSSNRAAIFDATDDNVATTSSYDSNVVNKCISIVSSVAILVDADFVSNDSDGFTINWTTVDANARIINYLALGTDITNTKVGFFSIPTSTGNQTITGVGFKPDTVLVFIGVSNASDPPINSKGNLTTNISFLVSPTSRSAISYRYVDNVSTTVARGYQRTDKAFVYASSVGVFAEADLVSMDSDGFTLNWSTANAIASRVLYLAIKGGRFKVGTFNQATGTGNQSTTAVGFKPSGVLLSSYNLTTQTTNQAQGRFSLGAANSSSSRSSIWKGSRDAQALSLEDHDLDRANVIKMMTEQLLVAPTTQAVADFVSNDSDGFTINWTTADATAREIIYWAFGDSLTNFIPRRMRMGIG